MALFAASSKMFSVLRATAAEYRLLLLAPVGCSTHATPTYLLFTEDIQFGAYGYCTSQLCCSSSRYAPEAVSVTSELSDSLIRT